MTSTEIPTVEGKLYLASVVDLASRRLPGFALGEHHDAELAAGALEMAAAIEEVTSRGTVFHSDYVEVWVKPRIQSPAWSGGLVA